MNRVYKSLRTANQSLLRRNIQSNIQRYFSSTSEKNTFMKTGLTEEQIEIQAMAADFSERQMFPFAGEWDENKIFPEDMLREAAQLGFGGVFVDPNYGGTGLDRLTGNIVFEQLAMGCTSTTAYITIHNMCAWMIDTFGNEQQKEKYLEAVCNMDMFASYCLTEPSAGSDAASLKTKAELKGDKYILNGEKAFISGGGRSDVYLIMARTGEPGPKGISCFVVEKDFPGITFGKNEYKLGWNTQPTAAVILDNCEVPVENRLGNEGDGFKIAMMGLDGGRLSIGTCSLGAAQQCFNQARDYVKQRKQFGQPLSNFQNTQFKLADMAVSLETSRLILREAARAMDNKDSDRTVKCSMAKKFATDRGFEVCNDSLQLHGGYGYLKEFPIERYLRDVRVHQILEGTNEVMQMIISRGVLADE